MVRLRGEPGRWHAGIFVWNPTDELFSLIADAVYEIAGVMITIYVDPHHIARAQAFLLIYVTTQDSIQIGEALSIGLNLMGILVLTPILMMSDV